MCRLSLLELEKGIKGLVVMSSSLEEIFHCIHDARVPSLWEKVKDDTIDSIVTEINLLSVNLYQSVCLTAFLPCPDFVHCTFTYELKSRECQLICMVYFTLSCVLI